MLRKERILLLVLPVILQLPGCFDFESPLARANNKPCNTQISGRWEAKEYSKDPAVTEVHFLNISVSDNCGDARFIYGQKSGTNERQILVMNPIFTRMSSGDYISLYTDDAEMNRKKRFLIIKYKMNDKDSLNISIPDPKQLAKAVQDGLVSGKASMDFIVNVNVDGSENQIRNFINTHHSVIYREWAEFKRAY